MSFRYYNLSHIHKFSPIIRVIGKGLVYSTNHNHHYHHLNEQLKHLQIGNGVVRKHDDNEEMEGQIIFPNNGRHHLENKLPKPFHRKKTITPLKYKF